MRLHGKSRGANAEAEGRSNSDTAIGWVAPPVCDCLRGLAPEGDRPPGRVQRGTRPAPGEGGAGPGTAKRGGGKAAPPFVAGPGAPVRRRLIAMPWLTLTGAHFPPPTKVGGGGHTGG